MHIISHLTHSLFQCTSAPASSIRIDHIVIYTTLLYRYLGPFMLWGVGILLCTIPVNSITLHLLSRLSKKENEARDSRIKRTT